MCKTMVASMRYKGVVSMPHNYQQGSEMSKSRRGIELQRAQSTRDIDLTPGKVMVSHLLLLARECSLDLPSRTSIVKTWKQRKKHAFFAPIYSESPGFEYWTSPASLVTIHLRKIRRRISELLRVFQIAGLHFESGGSASKFAETFCFVASIKDLETGVQRTELRAATGFRQPK